MKIAILGAGAMGALVGAHLKKGEEEVCFVDPYEAHMKKIQEDGLYMEIEGREPEQVRIDSAVTDSAEVGACDLVILLVKGMDTEAIIKKNPVLFHKDTVVVTLQNGIGNVAVLEKFFPRDRIGYGVLKASATLIEPGKIMGRVKFAYSPQGVFFAPVNSKSPYRYVYEQMEQALNQGGFPAAVSDQTEKIMWDKLFINVLYNAPCALVQLAGEDFMRHPAGMKLLKELAREVCEVASAKGILMDPQEYWEAECKNMKQVPEDQRHFTSTVLDVYHCRKTEIEFLNGAICREGNKYGIPTPYNQAIYYLMRVKEDTYSIVFQNK